MQELPLFPLNTVVFPGMPMPLHIFEERYKEMIAACLEQELPFGIVLIEEGEAEGDRNVLPRAVGCTVEITQVQRLPDGRMFIMTVGRDRFRIRRLDRSAHAYLTGQVELLPYEAEALDHLSEEVEVLHRLVLEYLTILADVGKIDFEVGQIPDDPKSLAFMAASLLNISLGKKQSLLESNKISRIIAYLLSAYDQEVKLLRLMPRDDEAAFSMN